MKSCTAAFAAFALLASARARRFTIDPSKQSGEGGDFEVDCLKHPALRPGDDCYLLNGDHVHDGLTRIHGTRNARITIHGQSKRACIKGSGNQDRALQIAHNFYTVENLCFDGRHGDDYASTAVYVLGAEKAKTSDDSYGIKSSVTGLRMYNLLIKNWDEECVHLRYFVTFAEIKGCTIMHCGKHSFKNNGGGAVGEAIYVGTALSQVGDSKAPEVKLRTVSADNVKADVTQRNWIHQNTFRTYGNECVDCKEGSTLNLIENNVCENQKDRNSGCIGSRGSGNTIRYNDISKCTGAGVRVGGDKDYGTHNNIYDNTITDADYGAFSVQAAPQGKVCGNKISNTIVTTQGAEKSYFKTNTVTGRCAENDTPGDIPELGTAGKIVKVEPASDDDGETRPLEEEEENDYDICAGVNCADKDEVGAIPEGDKIVEIMTNSNAGRSGLGDCGTVVSVVKLKAEHYGDRDTDTSADNLFDGDVDTYFSVNRESTFLVLELEQETDVHGVSIGFFMKHASEERIQTFDVAVRSYDETEYTIVISRKQSSGTMGDVQHFEFTSPIRAQYVKIESHGNSFNGWTALAEFEVCGLAAESNALFSGVRAAKNEIAELAGEVCNASKMLAPVWVRASGDGNIKDLFDGNFETRWSAEDTQADSDLDNAKIMMRFEGDVRVSHVDIAFFDGGLSRQHFSLYRQSATERTWTAILEDEIVSKTDSMQDFDVQQTRVNTLSIVGHGNDAGFFNKISEIQVYGC